MILDEQAIARLRESTSDGAFPKFAWPGGYTLMYLDERDNVLCAECADVHVEEGGKLNSCGTYDEGPVMYCDECNAEIESSYGDPDEEDEEEPVSEKDVCCHPNGDCLVPAGDSECRFFIRGEGKAKVWCVFCTTDGNKCLNERAVAVAREKWRKKDEEQVRDTDDV
jgi:hypothetical protein